tara:strand:- start:688 stop:1155 length:468 start_codon:yes stop_codon:yes gene_type:complete
MNNNNNNKEKIMKYYSIEHNNKEYDISKPDVSFQLNIVQKDDLERQHIKLDFQKSQIQHLELQKEELESEREILLSDNEQYRAIIIKLVKAINNTNFKDNLVRRSVSENTGKLNVKNRHYTELRNLLNDFTSKIPTKELMKIIEKEEAEDNKESA